VTEIYKRQKELVEGANRVDPEAPV
jgi:hypothetical protein